MCQKEAIAQGPARDKLGQNHDRDGYRLPHCFSSRGVGFSHGSSDNSASRGFDVDFEPGSNRGSLRIVERDLIPSGLAILLPPPARVVSRPGPDLDSLKQRLKLTDAERSPQAFGVERPQPDGSYLSLELLAKPIVR